GPAPARPPRVGREPALRTPGADREAALRPRRSRVPHAALRRVLGLHFRRRPVRPAPRAQDDAVAAGAAPVRRAARRTLAGRLARTQGGGAVPVGIRHPRPRLLRQPLRPGTDTWAHVGVTLPAERGRRFLDRATLSC